jgi:hypothetical protein
MTTDLDHALELSAGLRTAINNNYMPEVDRIAKELADALEAMKAPPKPDVKAKAAAK